MHALLERGEAAETLTAPSTRATPAPPRAEPTLSSTWERSGAYAAKSIRPGTAAAILLLHAAMLFALVKLDVVPLHRKAAPPLVVTLMLEQVAPPPAPPEQEVKPVEKVRQQVVVPPPVVTVAAPPPAPLVTAPEPPPPQAIVAAPAPASPVTGPPAPTTPPDASAATLGNPAPRYPIESRRRHEEGTVRLRVVITPEGRVKDIQVARSSGFDRLDRAALETVRRWKFRPGTQAGIAVEAVGFLNIPFALAA